MKTCPACFTQYTDDTLQYCLQDGSPLSAGPQAGSPTVAFGETETVVKPRVGGSVLDTQPSLSAESGASRQSGTGSRTAFAVGITALIMMLVFGALGIGAFLYFRDRRTDNRNSAVSQNGTDNRASIPVSSPSISPAPSARTPLPTPTPDKQAPVDPDTRDDVTGEIKSWRKTTEDMDLDSLMDHYAPRVDYYTKRGADIAFIRADKSRAFSRFTDIRMKLSNIQLTIDDRGDTVTAVFDKEWTFTGERSSKGKVRQLLELSRIDGRWLITAERDLKVY